MVDIEKQKKERSMIRIFNILKDKLKKTRNNFKSKLKSIIFENTKISNKIEILEDQLLSLDINLQTVSKIINNINLSIKNKEITCDQIYNQLHIEILNILYNINNSNNRISSKPYIIMLIGINGVGKTTTAVKLAYKYQRKGQRVILAAGDTFRAAAIDQLKILCQKYKMEVFSKYIGADSASVIFDAIQRSRNNNFDVLIIDTAGRMQNKINLIHELKKIIRVIKKIDIHAPHEVLIVLDTSIGQHTLNQVKIFHKEINVNGVIATKLDTSYKGGILISVVDRFKIPIRYICTGPDVTEIYNFNPNYFVNSILPLN